ncbi:MAG: hypothetical protein WA208_10755 [Thermoanaerobaculia bacterium]
MTTASQQVPFTAVQHHRARTALGVVGFWLVTALVVAASHALLEPLSVPACAGLTTAAILAAAYGYTRIFARSAGLNHALGVGVAWLTMALVVEVVMTAQHGQGWHGLLGAPEHPLLRNVFLFLWVFAPAFFAHRPPDED